jgi:endonuclease III
LRESGKGEGSIKWEAVREADLATVVKSIEKGGLAQTKGKRIKEILEIIYQQNSSRRDKLIEERQIEATSDGKPKEALAKKDLEIAKIDQNLLSMDFVFELTTDEAMDEMIKLPGIGVKTASCVILFCMKRPSFAVDTHVWRHCKWLGWVPPTATRDQTFSHCEVRIPDHLKYPLHQLFLRHGKTCGRCRGATSAGTEEWNNTICPIDHLVNRTGARKMGHGLPKGRKAKSASTSKKRKRDEDTEESELEEPELEEDDE